jgi:uncharacterized phage protein (TIGR01671 family)
MREIKFRAWGINSKEFLSPDGKVFGLTLKEIQNIEDISLWEFQQFTGLLDKKGKEIYEGDIMKVLDRDWSDIEKDTRKYIVYYTGGEFKLISKAGIEERESENPNQYNKEWIEARLFKRHGRDRFEVIGNVYENPDLIN